MRRHGHDWNFKNYEWCFLGFILEKCSQCLFWTSLCVFVVEDHLRLIFAGRQLEDYWLLSDCGVKHGDAIGLELIRRRDTEGRHQSMETLSLFSKCVCW